MLIEKLLGPPPCLAKKTPRLACTSCGPESRGPPGFQCFFPCELEACCSGIEWGVQRWQAHCLSPHRRAPSASCPSAGVGSQAKARPPTTTLQPPQAAPGTSSAPPGWEQHAAHTAHAAECTAGQAGRQVGARRCRWVRGAYLPAARARCGAQHGVQVAQQHAQHEHRLPAHHLQEIGTRAGRPRGSTYPGLIKVLACGASYV